MTLPSNRAVGPMPCLRLAHCGRMRTPPRCCAALPAAARWAAAQQSTRSWRHRHRKRCVFGPCDDFKSLDDTVSASAPQQQRSGQYSRRNADMPSREGARPCVALCAQQQPAGSPDAQPARRVRHGALRRRPPARRLFSPPRLRWTDRAQILSPSTEAPGWLCSSPTAAQTER
jgi:hypothetical protein